MHGCGGPTSMAFPATAAEARHWRRAAPRITKAAEVVTGLLLCREKRSGHLFAAFGAAGAARASADQAFFSVSRVLIPNNV